MLPRICLRKMFKWGPGFFNETSRDHPSTNKWHGRSCCPEFPCAAAGMQQSWPERSGRNQSCHSLAPEGADHLMVLPNGYDPNRMTSFDPILLVSKLRKVNLGT